MKRSQTVRISELNPHLMCVLCGGYYVDATTIIECLHSFCKACIVRYLDSSKFCPICDVQVHKTKPLLNIRPDHALQNLVYKLVPGLFTSEVLKRRQFYRRNPAASESASGGESTDGATDPEPSSNVVGDDTMSISLEFSIDGKAVQRRKSKKKGKHATKPQTLLQKRFLLCPALFTIGHVKKFIRSKFDLSPTLQVDVFHVEEPLSDSYALLDITFIYNWSKNEPFPLFFSVFENSAKRQKCDKQIPLLTTEPEPTTEPTDEIIASSALRVSAGVSGSASPSKEFETTISLKAVKRKLEEELSAVNLESNIDEETVSGRVAEDASAAQNDTVGEQSEEESDQRDNMFGDIPDGPSNGCKISTSSSGKNIVVSIPKHLLETSGSEKEKKKKSKRRDSHHHHKHHRKHRRQSKDKESSSKSKRRRESYEKYEQDTNCDNDSDASTSPASQTCHSTDVFSSPTTEHADITRNDDRTAGVSNNELNVTKSDTETGADSVKDPHDKSVLSEPDKKSDLSPKSETKCDSKKTVVFASEVVDKTQNDKCNVDRRPPSKCDVSPKRVALREPVLHQLQQEWNKSQQKEQEPQLISKSDTPLNNKTVEKVSVLSDKSPKQQSVETPDDVRSGESHKNKKSSATQNGNATHKPEPAARSAGVPSHKRDTSPHKKKTNKQRHDSNGKQKHKSTDVQSHKFKSNREASQKPNSQHNKDREHPTMTQHHRPSPKQTHEQEKQTIQHTDETQKQTLEEHAKTTHKKTSTGSSGQEHSSSDVHMKKSKPINELTPKPSHDDNKPLRTGKPNHDAKQSGNEYAPSHKAKPDQDLSLKHSDRHSTHSQQKQKNHASNGTTVSPQKTSPSMKGKTVSLKSFQDKLARKTNSMSPVNDSKHAKKHSVRLPEHVEARGVKINCSSSKLSTPFVSQAMTISVPSSPLYRATPSMDKDIKVPRRPSMSPRHTVSAPMVREERPNTLNVPMPWQSLTSLAEAGRKVQESANTALGRTSPCGSSAIQLGPSWLDERRNANGLQSPLRLPGDGQDNHMNTSISPFSDHLSTFESPSVPKGIKTYSKKDKVTYKNPNNFTHSPFAYESAFKSFLNSPTAALAAPRKPATDVSSYVSSTLVTSHKIATSPITNPQRHIHGHKVIGQLNMVYETIQKPSYAEIYRKQSKQTSPSKTPTYIFDKVIDGDQSKSRLSADVKDLPKHEVKQKDNNSVSNAPEAISSPHHSPPPPDKHVNGPSESPATSQNSVNHTDPSQSNSDGIVHQPESKSGKERQSPVAPTQSQHPSTHCESSFSAIHLASSPPRHGHMCGASSPSQAVCHKCSPRPRSTSPHLASSSHRSYSNSRPLLSSRDYPLERAHSVHSSCPRSVHSTCATGRHSPQNNNLSAASSVDLALHCDQCQSASVGSQSDPNIYAKMAPQEVPLNLHKPRNRADD